MFMIFAVGFFEVCLTCFIRYVIGCCMLFLKRERSIIFTGLMRFLPCFVRLHGQAVACQEFGFLCLYPPFMTGKLPDVR
jgi:hypothetical protein